MNDFDSMLLSSLVIHGVKFMNESPKLELDTPYPYSCNVWSKKMYCYPTLKFWENCLSSALPLIYHKFSYSSILELKFLAYLSL